MNETDNIGCLTCRFNREEIPGPGGIIYQDDLWQLQHVDPIALVGWLILKPLRHVESFTELTPKEAATFGPLTRRITRAMTGVLNPIKIYMSLYAEAEGFAHVHIHLIPRYADTPPERRGPGIFEYLRESKTSGQNLHAVADAERAASAIRQALQSGT